MNNIIGILLVILVGSLLLILAMWLFYGYPIYAMLRVEEIDLIKERLKLKEILIADKVSKVKKE